MAGLKLVIPGSFTDTSLPVLLDDPVLPPNQGGLLLLEPGHPASPLNSVPVNDQVLTNILAGQAKTLVGSSLDSAVNPVAKINSSFTGTAGKLELTSKKGIHGIVPQSGTAIADVGPQIFLPTNITRYLLQNKTNKIYVSFWGRLTRRPIAGGLSNYYMLAVGSQQTNAALNVLGPSTSEGGSYQLRPLSVFADGSFDNNYQNPSTSALGNLFSATNTKNYYNNGGTLNQVPDTGVPSPAGSIAISGIGWGSASNQPFGVGLSGITGSHRIQPASLNKDQASSFIMYRWYIEDLTVSGRSFATVKSLDEAEYTKQVLTLGGRYHNDTFTDPATIP